MQEGEHWEKEEDLEEDCVSGVVVRIRTASWEEAAASGEVPLRLQPMTI